MHGCCSRTLGPGRTISCLLHLSLAVEAVHQMMMEEMSDVCVDMHHCQLWQLELFQLLQELLVY